jgi:NADH:ubiquinone oxidoreductase subunit E
MKVQVCHGRTCTERFCEYINTRLENDVEKFKLGQVELEDSLCMGYCKKWPNIKIDGEVHHYVNPVKAAELIQPKPKKKVKKPNYNNKK